MGLFYNVVCMNYFILLFIEFFCKKKYIYIFKIYGLVFVCKIMLYGKIMFFLYMLYNKGYFFRYNNFW